MLNLNQPSKGFTLIELMVTVAIIGTLSSIAVVSFSKASLKARDAKRKADIAAIAQGLEKYFDRKGTYMVAETGWNKGGMGWANFDNGTTYKKSLVQALFSSGDMSTDVIYDPTPAKLTDGDSRKQYMIYSRPEGAITYGYCLYSFLENEDDSDYRKTYVKEGPAGSESVNLYALKMYYRQCGGELK